MKKVFFILFIILLLIFCYLFFSYGKNINKEDSKDHNFEYYDHINKNEIEFEINHYSIFGTHLNIEACADVLLENPILILKNETKEIELDSYFYNEGSSTCFYTSKNNNEGIYLDGLKQGNYVLLVKDNSEIYYTLNNTTGYEDLEYYTITKNGSNNKIDIKFIDSKENNYVNFIIEESKLPDDVYDISIDPGHGGNDSGAIGRLNGIEYYESNLTLDISLLLKQELENMGLKVILTREDDVYLNPYGKNGRAVVANEYSTKYSFSIHFNSSGSGVMSYGGVEIYIPNDIDYKLPKLLADNLSEIVGYSKNSSYRIDNGIYYKYFSQSEINNSNKNLEAAGQKGFDIVLNSPYLYMIRELGGINTYAYRDGRDDTSQLNYFYNSNQTTEPYLLELAYINYPSDLSKAVSNPELFSSAISSAIKEYLNIS